MEVSWVLLEKGIEPGLRGPEAGCLPSAGLNTPTRQHCVRCWAAADAHSPGLPLQVPHRKAAGMPLGPGALRNRMRGALPPPQCQRDVTDADVKGGLSSTVTRKERRWGS